MDSCQEVLTSHRRAERLLLEFLTPEQEEDYRRTLAFRVRGSSGTTYRLGNEKIEELDVDGNVARTLCVRPVGRHEVFLGPDLRPDWVLAQLLWLKTNEEFLVAIAGKFPLYPAEVPPPPRFSPPELQTELEREAYGELEDNRWVLLKYPVLGAIGLGALTLGFLSLPIFVLSVCVRRVLQALRFRLFR